MKKTVIVIAGIIVVALAFFVNAGSSSLDGYTIGDEVSDFSLPGIDGKEVSLSDYSSAKGFIVVFTCNTCPYAKMYEQRIVDLNNKYESKGFPVIAINPNDTDKKPEDSMAAMKKRASEKSYTFPYLRDDNQVIAKQFGATKTPHVYVLNNQANGYKVEFIGAIDDSPRDAKGVKKTFVEDAVNAIMNGKTPPSREEPAIGCTIKWTES